MTVATKEEQMASVQSVENGDEEAAVEHAEKSEEEVYRRSLEALDPPIGRAEKFRDSLLRLLDGIFFQRLGLLVLFLVVADGAIFFFFLMGWQTLCRPRTDCDPRNTIYNISVQILNVLFTYMVTVSMPWRCTNFIHINQMGCPHRTNHVGSDLYGIPTKDIWFHIPLRQRWWITFILIWNCLTQYANQTTRIVYRTYDEQNVAPGNIWTNVFFGSSFLFAGIGGAWQVYEEIKVRRDNPGVFPPGPVEIILGILPCCNTESDDNEEAPIEQQEKQNGEETEEATVAKERIPSGYVDPTRDEHGANVAHVSRPSMRMWGL